MIIRQFVVGLLLFFFPLFYLSVVTDAMSKGLVTSPNIPFLPGMPLVMIIGLLIAASSYVPVRVRLYDHIVEEFKLDEGEVILEQEESIVPIRVHGKLILTDKRLVFIENDGIYGFDKVESLIVKNIFEDYGFKKRVFFSIDYKDISDVVLSHSLKIFTKKEGREVKYLVYPSKKRKKLKNMIRIHSHIKNNLCK